jgi:thioredoxin reductase (NADPH)
MHENELYDLAIIGGGPAGLAAGVYAMRAALKTVLIEKGIFGGQVATTKEVENYLGFEQISGFELSEKFLKHAMSYGIEIIRHEAVKVTPSSKYHAVELDNSQIIRAHTLVLATGSSPRRLNVPGEEKYSGRGVSYCATCDGLFFKNQTVIVVGAGDTATEEAIYLAKIAKRVHMVYLEESMRSSRILQRRLMSECNVEIHPGSTVAEIRGDGNKVTSATIRRPGTGEIHELPVDGVFVFIGLAPNNQLAPAEIKRTAVGHIITDGKRETTVPGIFVVGDLRRKYANQISIAVADGCVGALAAAHFVEMKKEENRLCELYYPAA